MFSKLKNCFQKSYPILGFNAKKKATPDGELALYKGSLSAQKIIVMLWRDNSYANTDFLTKISSECFADDVTIIVLFSRATSFSILTNLTHLIPKKNIFHYSVYIFLKCLFNPFYLRFLPGHCGFRTHSFQRRQENAIRFLNTLPTTSNIVLSGFSAGARLATSIADLYPNISLVLCFGYPFHNPKAPGDTTRYMHLYHLKKSTAVVQGVHDSYGNDMFIKYLYLPSHYSFLFVMTDHSYVLHQTDLEVTFEFLKKHLPNSFVRDPHL